MIDIPGELPTVHYPELTPEAPVTTIDKTTSPQKMERDEEKLTTASLDVKKGISNVSQTARDVESESTTIDVPVPSRTDEKPKRKMKKSERNSSRRTIDSCESTDSSEEPVQKISVVYSEADIREQNLIKMARAQRESEQPNSRNWEKISTEIEESKLLEEKLKHPTSLKETNTANHYDRESRRNPAFDLYLTNRSVCEGATVKLTCCVSGQNCKIRWYKGDELLTVGRKFKMHECEGLVNFEVHNATLEDSGEYRCVVTNANGHTETSSIVDVYRKFNDTCDNIPPIFTRAIRGKCVLYFVYVTCCHNGPDEEDCVNV